MADLLPNGTSPARGSSQVATDYAVLVFDQFGHPFNTHSALNQRRGALGEPHRLVLKRSRKRAHGDESGRGSHHRDSGEDQPRVESPTTALVPVGALGLGLPLLVARFDRSFRWQPALNTVLVATPESTRPCPVGVFGQPELPEGPLGIPQGLNAVLLTLGDALDQAREVGERLKQGAECSGPKSIDIEVLLDVLRPRTGNRHRSSSAWSTPAADSRVSIPLGWRQLFPPLKLTHRKSLLLVVVTSPRCQREWGRIFTLELG